MKIASAVMFLIFAFFCAVQLNDPDTFLWIGLYGFAAVVSALSFFGRASIVLLVVGLGVFSGGVIFLVPKMSWNWMDTEGGRECIGLLISAIWMGVLLRIQKRKKI